jgi:hypothetical protein
VVFSIMLSYAVMILLNLLLITSKETYEKFNKALITRKLKKIKTAYMDYSKERRIQYVVYITCSFILASFTFTYVLIFCTVYSSAGISWLISCIFSMIILFTVQVAISLLHSAIRSLIFSRKCKKIRVMKYIYLLVYYIF